MLRSSMHASSMFLHDACQVHEWSGVFKNMLLHSHFRRFRPGLRVAVNLFGGHYWRTQVRLHLHHRAPGTPAMPMQDVTFPCMPCTEEDSPSPLCL